MDTKNEPETEATIKAKKLNELMSKFKFSKMPSIELVKKVIILICYFSQKIKVNLSWNSPVIFEISHDLFNWNIKTKFQKGGHYI